MLNLLLSPSSSPASNHSYFCTVVLEHKGVWAGRGTFWGQTLGINPLRNVGLIHQQQVCGCEGQKGLIYGYPRPSSPSPPRLSTTCQGNTLRPIAAAPWATGLACYSRPLVSSAISVCIQHAGLPVGERRTIICPEGPGRRRRRAHYLTALHRHRRRVEIKKASHQGPCPLSLSPSHELFTVKDTLCDGDSGAIHRAFMYCERGGSLNGPVISPRALLRLHFLWAKSKSRIILYLMCFSTPLPLACFYRAQKHFTSMAKEPGEKCQLNLLRIQGAVVW